MSPRFSSLRYMRCRCQRYVVATLRDVPRYALFRRFARAYFSLMFAAAMPLRHAAMLLMFLMLPRCFATLMLIFRCHAAADGARDYSYHTTQPERYCLCHADVSRLGARDVIAAGVTSTIRHIMKTTNGHHTMIKRQDTLRQSHIN